MVDTITYVCPGCSCEFTVSAINDWRDVGEWICWSGFKVDTGSMFGVSVSGEPCNRFYDVKLWLSNVLEPW